MDGGVNFGDYNADKHLDDVRGLRRMAGEVFQKTFGDKGWNEEFTSMHKEPLLVDRNPTLDYVAAKAKEEQKPGHDGSIQPQDYSQPPSSRKEQLKRNWSESTGRVMPEDWYKR